MKFGSLFLLIAIGFIIIPSSIEAQTSCDQTLPTILLKNGLIATLPNEQEVTIAASHFNAASFDNLTPKDALQFSFSKIPADSLRTFDCTNLGQVNLKIWVTDLAGNQQGVTTFIIIQDNQDVCFGNTPGCIPALFSDNGLVANISGEGELDLNIKYLNKGFIPNCVIDSVEYTYSNNLNDSTRIYSCDEIGLQNLQIWGKRPAGNFSFLENFVEVQDNKEYCEFLTSPACLPIPIIRNGLITNAPPNNVTTVFASMYDFNSISECSQDKQLRFSFSEDITDTLRQVSFDDAGVEQIDIWVTDANGNQSLASTFLNIQANPDITINCCDIEIDELEVLPALCEGDSGVVSISIDSDFPPYNYNWSHGLTVITQGFEQTQKIPPGPVELTVTDNIGCVGSWSGNVLELPPLTLINMDSTQPPCQGSDLGSIQFEIMGGQPIMDSLYEIHTLWNGKTELAKGVNLDSLPPGNYCFEILDTNNCILERCFTLEYQRGYELLKDSTNVLCFGDATGNIDVNVSLDFGFPVFPYTYLWSGDHPITNQNDQTFTSGVSELLAGTYSLTMTDGEGCTSTTSINIEEPPPLAPQLEIISQPACFGDFVVISIPEVLGGNSSFFQFWQGDNDPKPLGDTIQLFAGTYELNVKEIATGCLWDSTITIQQPPPLSIDSLQTLPETCFGLSDGALRFRVSGGALDPQGDYTIAISNLGVFQSDIIDFTNLAAGNYGILVGDANGCTISENVDIEVAKNLLISADISHIKCFGDDNGEIYVEISSIGEPPNLPFEFEWSGNPAPPPAVNEPDNSTLPNLASGNYQVIATDADGCVISGIYNIVEPPKLVASFGIGSEPACPEIANGWLRVNADGGTFPYDFLWSTNPPQTTMEAINLPEGNLIVTISDENDCAVVLDTVLEAGPKPIVELLSQTDESCQFGNDGTAAVAASLGNGVFKYVWSTIPVQSDSIATGLPAGIFEVTATDTVGCSGSLQIEIKAQTLPEILSLENDSLLCFNDADGILEVAAISDSLPLIFNWSNGEMESIIDSLSSGTYYLTVTDQKACSVVDTVIVWEPPRMMQHIPEPGIPNCFGQDVSVTVDHVSGGNGAPYLFSVNGSDFSELGEVLAVNAGPILITIIDGEGCTKDTMITASTPPPIIISLDHEDLELCEPIPLQLNISDLGRIIADSTKWVILEGEEDALSCFNCMEPIFFPGSALYYEFMVIVRDSLGCKDSLTIDTSPLHFPDLFTPNGDGANDYFEIKACENLGKFENELLVLNQWGNIVFQTDNYQNDWDGTWKGKPLPEASYYYSFKIEILGRTLEKTGRIAILR